MTKGLLAERAREIEALLDEVLPPANAGPVPIHEAMYVVLGRQAPPGYHGSCLRKRKAWESRPWAQPQPWR